MKMRRWPCMADDGEIISDTKCLQTYAYALAHEHGEPNVDCLQACTYGQSEMYRQHDNDEKPDRATQLVNAHWNEYVEKLLDVTIQDGMVCTKSQVMEQIKFHYISSGIHFYNHAVEDAQNEN